MRRSYKEFIKLFIFILFCCLILVITDRIGPLASFRSSFETMIVRLRFNPPSSQQSELESQKSKIASLESQIATLRGENESLRKQLEAPLPASFEYIPARILGIESEGRDVIMLVGAGELDGVNKNMRAIFEDGLIGIVTDTTPRMSRLKLLSSADSSVVVKTVEGAHGIITGQGEEGAFGPFILDKVPKEESVAIGNILVTSGKDGTPPDLIVGKVREIISEDRDPFIRAYVDPILDIRKLREVFLIKE